MSFSEENYKNKKILVAGAGKSGVAAAQVLKKFGAAVTVYDGKPEKDIDKKIVENFRNGEIETCFGKDPEEIYDVVLLSPGIPPAIKPVEKQREAGAEITGELEEAFRLAEGNFVAITGTNGKTTTTTLTGEIFKNAGLDTRVVGNIGNPVITEAYNSDENTWMITEVSSFQLETANTFKPHISALLNITPDHLNRHKTMEKYIEAKAKVTTLQTEEDFFVYNMEDSETAKVAEKTAATKLPFSGKRELEVGAFVKDGKIVFSMNGELSEICAVKDILIIGDHNIENILAAVAISKAAGISDSVINKTVTEFKGVDHRLEFVRELDGVKYYNDSKGTNTDATEIAIKAIKSNIILIAGGDAKSQDFSDLAKHFKGSVKRLVLMGRDASYIKEAALKEGFEEITECKNMKEAVKAAYDFAQKGDTVLLSPACASWDMYNNYEERGEEFKDCARGL